MPLLKELYDQWQEGGPAVPAVRGLTPQECEPFLARGWKQHVGKVRDSLWKGAFMVIFHSDRLSAADRMVGEVPYRGELLAALARHCFDHLPAHLPHHYIRSLGPRIMLCHRCDPIGLEVVVRGYRAGSFHKHLCADHLDPYREELDDVTWREYKSLPEYAPLPQPLVHFTTKGGRGESDQALRTSEALRQGLGDEAELGEMRRMALQVFEWGGMHYLKRGWILADTKIEFGRSLSVGGKLLIMDEILTSDCSRLWRLEGGGNQAGAFQSWDKDIVRHYLASQGQLGSEVAGGLPLEVVYKLAIRYLEVCEEVMGSSFRVEDPKDSKADQWLEPYREELLKIGDTS